MPGKHYRHILLASALAIIGLLLLFLRTVLFLVGPWMTHDSQSNLLPRLKPLASEDEVERAALALFQHADQEIAQIDLRAYLTIVVDALLLGLLIISERVELRGLLGDTSTTHHLAAFFLLLTVLALLISCAYALYTLLPRLSDRDRITLLHFDHIAALGQEKFVRNFQQQPLRELRSSLVIEVYTKAKIMQRKLGKMRWSIGLLCASLLFWVTMQLILLF